MGADGEAIRSWRLVDLDGAVEGYHALVKHRLHVRTAHVGASHEGERRLMQVSPPLRFEELAQQCERAPSGRTLELSDGKQSTERT